MTASSKILICGLGSMGKRRLRILQSAYPQMEIMGVDIRKDRFEDVGTQFNIPAGQDFLSALSRFKPGYVFVCTPPKFHTQIVLAALEHNAHTFSEINLSSNGYEKIIHTARSKGRTAFLSSTPLYREEINWIIGQVENKQRISYRYHVGQYLPDWHPWESYKDFFVREKAGSACKEIMAIEFPWICRAFGPVKNLRVMKAKFSDLDIDYEDTFHLLFEHGNGVLGNVSIDCVSEKAVRKLEIFSDTLYLEWKGFPDSLEIFSRAENKMVKVSLYKEVERLRGYQDFIIENPYVEEIKAFFSAAVNPESVDAKYGYRMDGEILNLVEKVVQG